MTISIGLSLALGISIILNIFAVWYIRALLGRFNWISQNINDLVQIIGVFRAHLQDVRKLEQFYGDQEIKNLALHTASLMDVLQDYEDVVFITEPIEFVEDELDTQQQEEQNAEEEVEEKHVLYAGTRERNN
jgi:hypothetical protein